MKNIEINVFIKFYFLLLLIKILLLILWLDFSYWLFWFNYIFFTILINIFISIIHIYFLIKYFKNPKKYFNIIIWFIIFYLILYILSFNISWFKFKNIFNIIVIIYNFIYLYIFIKFKKLLNSWKILLEEDKKNNVKYYKTKVFWVNKYLAFSLLSTIITFILLIITTENTYLFSVVIIVMPLLNIVLLILYFKKLNKIKIIKWVELTNKNQFKSIFLIYWTIVFSLMIFYFLYYSVPVVEFKYIDNAIFENNHKYKDIIYEDNWLENLIEYVDYLKTLEYKETPEILNFYKSEDSIKNLKLNIEKVEEIDKLRIWVKEIISKKAIVYNIDWENYPSLSWLTSITRETLYNILYYLENWDQEKAINYMINDYKFWDIIMNSNWTFYNYIIWLAIQKINIDKLNYILDNYNLTEKSLFSLKEVIKQPDYIKDSYKNSIIYEYESIRYLLKHSIESKYPNINNWSFIFFTKNYYDYGLKNVTYSNMISEKSDFIQKFNNNDDRLKYLFFKKNSFSNLVILIYYISLDGYLEEAEKLINDINNILEKINNLY